MAYVEDVFMNVSFENCTECCLKYPILKEFSPVSNKQMIKDEDYLFYHPFNCFDAHFTFKYNSSKHLSDASNTKNK